MMANVRITHRDTGLLLADGPLGWGITPFEENFYVSRKHLKTKRFHPNFVPGFCIYKFMYVWLDLKLTDDNKLRNLGWMYWQPFPLLPFIWFRVAIPRDHPALEVVDY